MGRKSPSREKFKYNIPLVHENFRVKASSLPTSLAWKKKAISLLTLRFYYQILKSEIEIKKPVRLINGSRGYAAPGRLEYFSFDSALTLCPATKELVLKHRRYWFHCRKTSLEIFKLLATVDPDRYSKKLHFFLKSLIVTRTPFLSEAARYEKDANIFRETLLS